MTAPKSSAEQNFLVNEVRTILFGGFTFAEGFLTAMRHRFWMFDCIIIYMYVKQIFLKQCYIQSAT